VRVSNPACGLLPMGHPWMAKSDPPSFLKGENLESSGKNTPRTSPVKRYAGLKKEIRALAPQHLGRILRRQDVGASSGASETWIHSLVSVAHAR